MNEHQFNHDSNLHLHDSASQQHLVSEIAAGHIHNHTSIEPIQQDHSSQSTYEQQNQVDYFQSSYDAVQNQEAYSLNHSASGLDGVQQNTFHEPGQDPSSFLEQNNSTWEQQYLDSTYQENHNLNKTHLETQNNHSGLEVANQASFNDLSANHFQTQNPAEVVSNTQDYNNNIWEQQYQQRSGHAPTANDLNKALDLEHQAQEEQKMYENDTRWAKNVPEYFGNAEQAYKAHQSAAVHKQEAEDLQAEADKIRNQT
ncbi:MAG: hypothetical protein RLZZ04_4752 [Cyanobacteriota bacterium]|jgi:hypothetical protein